jgi:hypothetical protein
LSLTAGVRLVSVVLVRPTDSLLVGSVLSRLVTEVLPSLSRKVVEVGRRRVSRSVVLVLVEATSSLNLFERSLVKVFLEISAVETPLVTPLFLEPE